MTIYTVTATAFGKTPVAAAFTETGTPATSPRIVGNGTASPRIEWDPVPGATGYKTYWPGRLPSPYLNHPASATSWTIDPTIPGGSQNIGWSWQSPQDHWITPELLVTFNGSPPPPPPPPPSGRFFGLVANSDQSKAIESGRRVGNSIIRCEFAHSASNAQLLAIVTEAGGKGQQVIPHPDIDGAYGAAATSMARWGQALAGKVQYIEFGNENGYSYKGTQGTGASYGQAARTAKNALAGTGITLIVQADDGNTGSGWIGSMIGAAPELRTGVVFTCHPYGPRSKWEPRIARHLAELRSAGVTDPKFIITEWGISTDNGANLNDNYGWPTNMTYVQTGDAVRADIPAIFARFPEVIGITYFQAHDQLPPGTGQRERHFGVVKNDQSDKVGLTDDIRFLTSTYR